MYYSLRWSSFFMTHSNFFRVSFPQATAGANCSSLILQSSNSQQDRLQKVREKERCIKTEIPTCWLRNLYKGEDHIFFAILQWQVTLCHCFSGQLILLTQPPVQLKVPEQFLYSLNKCFTHVKLLNKGSIKGWGFFLQISLMNLFVKLLLNFIIITEL